ncbi:MAG TPA: type II toxin-antitoxin system Phd/YefM family antitoxin [Candidatus Sulfotelmatobacter sp.]|nr:type II toxin-antitoxin system Phd/YefM family antitoxin [Candidatus Sulfotelmatobacter sp.]
MASPAAGKQNATLISALRARSSFGRILKSVEGGEQSLVIEKRGRPRAVLLGIPHYVKLAAPEPEVLKLIGEAAKRDGTNKLTARKIDQIIEAARIQKRKRP